jgi:hypothetical protein
MFSNSVSALSRAALSVVSGGVLGDQPLSERRQPVTLSESSEPRLLSDPGLLQQPVVHQVVDGG